MRPALDAVRNIRSSKLESGREQRLGRDARMPRPSRRPVPSGERTSSAVPKWAASGAARIGIPRSNPELLDLSHTTGGEKDIAKNSILAATIENLYCRLNLNQVILTRYSLWRWSRFEGNASSPRCASRYQASTSQVYRSSWEIRRWVSWRSIRDYVRPLLIGDASKPERSFGWRHRVSFDELVRNGAAPRSCQREGDSARPAAGTICRGADENSKMRGFPLVPDMGTLL